MIITHHTTIDLDQNEPNLTATEKTLATGVTQTVHIDRMSLKTNNTSILQLCHDFKSDSPNHHVWYRDVTDANAIKIMWDSEQDVYSISFDTAPNSTDDYDRAMGIL